MNRGNTLPEAQATSLDSLNTLRDLLNLKISHDGSLEVRKRKETINTKSFDEINELLHVVTESDSKYIKNTLFPKLVEHLNPLTLHEILGKLSAAYSSTLPADRSRLWIEKKAAVRNVISQLYDKKYNEFYFDKKLWFGLGIILSERYQSLPENEKTVDTPHVGTLLTDLRKWVINSEDKGDTYEYLSQYFAQNIDTVHTAASEQLQSEHTTQQQSSTIADTLRGE